MLKRASSENRAKHCDAHVERGPDRLTIRFLTRVIIQYGTLCRHRFVVKDEDENFEVGLKASRKLDTLLIKATSRIQIDRYAEFQTCMRQSGVSET